MNAGAAVPLERSPPRSDGLDPRLAALIEAMARDAAAADHRAAITARPEEEPR